MERYRFIQEDFQPISDSDMKVRRTKQFVLFSFLILAILAAFLLWLYQYRYFSSVEYPSLCSSLTAIYAIIWFYIVIVNSKKDFSSSNITPFEQMWKVLANKPDLLRIAPILHTQFRNFEIISDAMDQLECYGEDWNGKKRYISNEGFNELIKKSSEIKEITIRLSKDIVKPEDIWKTRKVKKLWPEYSILIKYNNKLSGDIITIGSEKSDEIAKKYLNQIATYNPGTNTLIEKIINNQILLSDSPPKLSDPYIFITRGYLTLTGIFFLIGLVGGSSAFILAIIAEFYIGLPALAFVILVLLLLSYGGVSQKKVVINNQAIQYWFQDKLVFHLNWENVKKIENGIIYVPYAGGAYSYIRIYDEFNMFEIRSYDVPVYQLKRIYRKIDSCNSQNIDIRDELHWL